MRVLITGGTGCDAARIAAALEADGIVIASPDASFDLMLTLGAPPHRYQCGDLTVDLFRRRAAQAGRPIALTPREFAILAHLAQARRPVDRGELLREIWNIRFDPGTNVVAVHISRLRAKLGAAAIEYGGGGYRLADPHRPIAAVAPHAPECAEPD